MRTLFIIIFWSLGFEVTAQQTISIRFHAVMNEFPLKIDQQYLLQNDTIIIEALKFFISDIQLLKDNKIISSVEKKHHLLDFENSQTLQIIHTTSEDFDAIKFNLGIDSATNVSGAMGGDLDPTKGMYWTWQSGYINFKLEGTSKLCKTRNNEFQFHLGGYMQPNYCLQTLSFPVSNSSIININLDVQHILEQIDLISTNHVMSPGSEAVRLSKIVAASITLKQ